jgi:hypothetical protein
MPAQCNQERKAFFSEEKKQKTFISFAALPAANGHSVGAGAEEKVFWFFFSKKNILPSFMGK